MLGAWLALTLAATPLQQTSAENPAQADETTLSDVVVDGRPLYDQARDYIAEVARPAGRYRLARWAGSICVSVTGLDARYAQFVVDRVSAVAASVGLDPGAPGCRPEVVIAFTRNPDGVARAWVSDDMDTFRLSRTGGTDLGAQGLEQFQASDDPVRAWHVSTTVFAASGRSVDDSVELSPVISAAGATPSLIQSSSYERLIRTFIVVDADRIDQASFGSLGDYLAFVALAQIDPGSETAGLDTVLNLFSDQPSARLSAWDFDYLQSLYRLHGNPMRASTQQRRMARLMSNRLAEAALE